MKPKKKYSTKKATTLRVMQPLYYGNLLKTNTRFVILFVLIIKFSTSFRAMFKLSLTIISYRLFVKGTHLVHFQCFGKFICGLSKKPDVLRPETSIVRISNNNVKINNKFLPQIINFKVTPSCIVGASLLSRLNMFI
jgi:hypothetical protein